MRDSIRRINRYTKKDNYRPLRPAKISFETMPPNVHVITNNLNRSDLIFYSTIYLCIICFFLCLYRHKCHYKHSTEKPIKTSNHGKNKIQPKQFCR